MTSPYVITSNSQHFRIKTVVGKSNTVVFDLPTTVAEPYAIGNSLSTIAFYTLTINFRNLPIAFSPK